MARFEGKVALVTGAASGMGRATAIRLAAEGACVVMGDIDAAGAEATRETIVADGGEALAVAYDAMDDASCVALVGAAVAVQGRLDVVANVGGISAFYRLDETSTEVFERFLRVNLTSVLVICREAMPHLVETGGSIVNFSSINGRMPVAYHAGYDASKAGVLALTKGIAQEFASAGVRCNAVCPGGFDTPMNEGIRIPEGMDFEWIRKLSNPRIPFGRPEEAAGVVAFLASEDASYINGEQIVVDGALTASL